MNIPEAYVSPACPNKDQGHLGSWTANAGVGMYEYMENKARGKYIDGSRLFLYKATRLLMGQEGIGDSGAYIRTTLGAIRLFGIPYEQFWQYTDDPERFDKMPDRWLWALGQYFLDLSILDWTFLQMVRRTYTE